MELDLHQLIRIFRRRWWILILVTLVAAGGAYGASSRQTPLYQATATMIVNPGALVGSSDSSSLQESQRLAQTYRQLITTSPMKTRVAAALGDDDVTALTVTASAVPDTLLIRVTVTDPDPDYAASVANSYVTEFQGYISDQNADRISQTRSSVDSQIELLNEQIATIDTQISANPERADLRTQRQALVTLVSQLESDAARAEMQATSASAFVEMVEPATAPDTPTSPQIGRSTILGAFVGLLLAVGVIALLEYLDNTVKGHTNLQALAHAPILSSIPVNPGIEQGARQIYTIADQKSPAAEAIRLLRTNLTFAGVEQEIRSLAVSSSIESEGKSTVAANLAVAVASSGKAVALIDADLRRPTQHRLFGIDNTRGLSTVIADHSKTWQDTAERVALPGLVLISSGPTPPNPSEMLSSGRFKHILDQLAAEFDLVIVDTPPILQASDGLIAGGLTDGLVVVVQHGRTRIDAVKGSSSLIHQSGTRLIGLVPNRVAKSEAGYYGGSYYGSYYGTYGND